MKKYISFFFVEMARLHEFRLDFGLFWTECALRFFAVILFWKQAIALGAVSTGAMGAETFVSILVVTRLFAFPIQDGDRIAAALETPVVTGTMNSLLCRPIHPIWMNLMRFCVDKSRQMLLSLLLLWLAVQYGWAPTPAVGLGWVVISMVLGVLIHFFIYTLAGILSFWIGYVWSILYLLSMTQVVMAGTFFPLDAVPGLAEFSRYLPFRYCAYSAASIYTGRSGLDEILYQCLFLAGLALISELFWRRALLHYESCGG